jgi:alpha-methylacyl-CoA racemase
MTTTATSPDTPASGAGPLQGLRVLEMGAIGPVPYAATLLADLGADVIRVDRLSPSGLGVPVPPEADVHGRSRRSVAIDLKRPEGVSLALSLVERSDILLEGFRPGVMEGLGLGPDACLARQPGLIYGRMTGYGQTGPWAGYAGHDLNYIALAGALAAIGPADANGGLPTPPLNLVGDYGGGSLFLLLGVLSALHERQRSGRGQVVDAAMFEGAASLMGFFRGLTRAGHWTPERGANLLDGGAPFYAVYRCADGQHLALGALEARFFGNFLRAVGLDEGWLALQHDQAQWPAMRQAIAQTLCTQNRDHWLVLLADRECCVAPVLSLDDAVQHPQAQAREAHVAVGGLMQPAPVPRFSRTPLAHPRPAPAVGANTASVLTEMGFSAEQQAQWQALGLIPEAPTGSSGPTDLS